VATIFGTNIQTSLVHGGVWPYGQLYGFAFCIFGLALLLMSAPSAKVWRTVAYVFLALAVGCRPFYLYYTVLFCIIDRTRSGDQWAKIMARVVVGMAPIGVALAAYNWIRFHDPLQFGHALLPHELALPAGSFSTAYLSHNIWHAFGLLPHFADC